MNHNQLLSIKDMADLLSDKRLSIVAKRTGLSFPTLKSIADGKELNYTISTLQKVTDYLTRPV